MGWLGVRHQHLGAQGTSQRLPGEAGGVRAAVAEQAGPAQGEEEGGEGTEEAREAREGAEGSSQVQSGQ